MDYIKVINHHQNSTGLNDVFGLRSPCTPGEYDKAPKWMFIPQKCDIVGCVLYIYTIQKYICVYIPIATHVCWFNPHFHIHNHPYPIGQGGKDRKLDTIGMLENHKS